MKKILISTLALLLFFNVNAQLDTLFFDDFEGVNNWVSTVSNPSHVGWELGMPADYPLNSTHSGINAWMTDLDSIVPDFAIWYLESPIIDFTNVQNARLSFWEQTWMSRWRAGFNLEYTTDVNSPNPNWSLLGTASSAKIINQWYDYSNVPILSGPGWVDRQRNWEKQSYFLDILNNIGDVKFRFIFKSSNNAYEIGAAIDDFLIELPDSIDLQITNFELGNTKSDYELIEGDSTSIEIDIMNLGNSRVDTFDVFYTVNGSNLQTITIIDSLNIAQKKRLSFGTIPHFIAPRGKTEINITVQARGDTNLVNSNFNHEIWSIPTLSLPYQDNFDSPFDSLNFWNPCIWDPDFETEWEKGTPTTATLDSAFSAPNAWVTKLDTTHSSLFWNYLCSPEFDFSNTNNQVYELKFHQKRVLDTVSMYWLEFSANGGQSWGRLGWLNDPKGRNWYNVNSNAPGSIGFVDGFKGNTINYEQSSYILPSFNSPTRFRFFFIGNQPNEGVAIDDFSLQPATEKDIVLNTFSSPNPCPVLLPDSVTIRFSISNLSNDTITNIPFNYSFNGIPQLPTAYIWTDTLFPGAYSTVELPPYFSTIVGSYDLTVYSELAGDLYRQSDTIHIEVCGNVAQELEIVSLISDTCYYQGDNSIQILVKNNGHSIIDSLTAHYKLNGGNTISQNFNGINLLAGSSKIIQFSTLGNIFSGANNIELYVSKLLADNNSTNDTLNSIIQTHFIENVPYRNDFEQNNALESFCTKKTRSSGGVNHGSSLGCNQPKSMLFYSHNITANWTNSNLTNIWNSNVNPSYLSSSFIKLNTANNNFLRLKLKRNFINAPAGRNQEKYFRILINDTSIYEENVLTTNPNCDFVNLFLKPFYSIGDTISIEFQTKMSFFNAIALDDIEIVNLPNNSLGIANVITNPIQIIPGSQTTVSAVLKNTGNNDISSALLTLEINGQVIQNQYFTFNSLKTGESTIVTFSNAFIARNAPNNICVYQANPDDDPSDDRLCTSPNPAIVFNYPYCQDFESNDGNWLNFIITDSLTNTWQFGSPAQTQINSAHSGSNVWMTGLNDNYQNFADAHLITPGFQVEKDSCYQLSFWHQYLSQNNIDGGTVEYSVDSGSSWQQVGNFGDVDWFSHQAIQSLWNFNSSPILPGSGWSGNSAGWQEAINRFKLNRDGVVHFRFRFASDVSNTNEGWAIDDFCFERINSACANVSVQEINWDEILVQVYPNPSNGKFYFQLDLEASKDQTIQITITDFLGKTIIQKNIKTSEKQPLELDLSGFSSGLYHYQIKMNNKKTNGKLVKY